MTVSTTDLIAEARLVAEFHDTEPHPRDVILRLADALEAQEDYLRRIMSDPEFDQELARLRDELGKADSAFAALKAQHAAADVELVNLKGSDLVDLVFTASCRQGVMGGAPCIDGTRIPTDTVFYYGAEEGGNLSLATLLHYFPQLEGKVTERPVGGTE